jgi:hypothetical protein
MSYKVSKKQERCQSNSGIDGEIIYYTYEQTKSVSQKK